MPDTRNLRRRRLNAFEEQGGRCYWCGEQMVLTDLAEGTLPANAATVEHLYPRIGGIRQPSRSGRVTVAACNRCNNNRGCTPLARMPQPAVRA